MSWGFLTKEAGLHGERGAWVQGAPCKNLPTAEWCIRGLTGNERAYSIKWLYEEKLVLEFIIEREGIYNENSKGNKGSFSVHLGHY